MAQKLHEANTFRGRLRPGPGRVAIRILPEQEDYTIPGSGLRLWLPRPSSHEGFTGVITVQAAPYFNADTGQEYAPIFLKDQIVVVGKFTGTQLTLNRDKYIICREIDILCEVITDEDEEQPVAESASSDQTT